MATIKPKDKLFDSDGIEYEIVDVGQEYFTFKAKHISEWDWRDVSTPMPLKVMEDLIKERVIFLDTPANRVLYGKE